MKIIETVSVSKIFKLKKISIPAVEDLNLQIYKTDFLSLVGESGSGKSTVARLILRLIKPDNGNILFRDRDIWQLDKNQLKDFRQSVQIVFQDPYASLNPRMTVFSILEEPLKIHKKYPAHQIETVIKDLIIKMGLDKDIIYRYPHQLSGGQRQRIAIARALILKPQILVADEPLSSLDISLQASLLKIIDEMRNIEKFGVLFITHDLNIVRTVSNKVAVMHLGRIVEEASKEELFKNPLHPYTKTLLDSIPGFHRRGRKKQPRLTVEMENLWSINGCRFFPRCPFRMPVCKDNTPILKQIGQRKVRCFLY